jgi:hypothetical protein
MSKTDSTRAPPTDVEKTKNKDDAKTLREKNRQSAIASRQRKTAAAAAAAKRAKERRVVMVNTCKSFPAIRYLADNMIDKLKEDGPYMRQGCMENCKRILEISEGVRDDVEDAMLE